VTAEKLDYGKPPYRFLDSSSSFPVSVILGDKNNQPYDEVDEEKRTVAIGRGPT